MAAPPKKPVPPARGSLSQAGIGILSPRHLTSSKGPQQEAVNCAGVTSPLSSNGRSTVVADTIVKGPALVSAVPVVPALAAAVLTSSMPPAPPLSAEFLTEVQPVQPACDQAGGVGGKLQEKQLGQIHSMIRWDKPSDEIEAVVKQAGVSMLEAISTHDSKTGNVCLHIAAQNGHIGLVKYLVKERANVNVQNFKGQTPLHMSVQYDFFFQSKFLLENGADPNISNQDGYLAIKGLDGLKEGAEAWDNPGIILKAASTKEEIDFAMSKLEQSNPDQIDKVQLVQTGMAKKRAHKEAWDAERFAALLKRL